MELSKALLEAAHERFSEAGAVATASSSALRVEALGLDIDPDLVERARAIPPSPQGDLLLRFEAVDLVRDESRSGHTALRL